MPSVLLSRGSTRHARVLTASIAALGLGWATHAVPAVAASSTSLAVSTNADRSASWLLKGATFAPTTKVYVFVAGAGKVKKVRFYLDDPRQSGTPRTVEVTPQYDFNGTASNGTAVAFDLATVAAGTHTVSALVDRTGSTQVLSAPFTVAAPAPAPDPAPAPAPSTDPVVEPPLVGVALPAAFPSRLRVAGRSIVDENGYALPTLRGFNMHVGPGFTWEQSHFDAIAARGGRLTRAVLHWDQFEPTRGVVSSTAIAALDAHVARARAAGLYTLLDLHLNVGRTPAWAADVTGETERYAAYGRTLTQYLAARYGDPSSPQYTKAVIGFGLNEPPVSNSTIRNGNSSIPWLEDKQRQMISWMRVDGGATDWIGFVAMGYAAATPIYDDATQNPNAIDASPTAYAAVGGNVVLDVHDYMMGCEVSSSDPANHTLSTDPACDGRQWNGMIYPTTQGGPLIGTDDASHSYVSTAASRAQLGAFVKPYKAFSAQAGIPLMLGEWGWAAGTTGELPWIADQQAVWADAGTVIQMDWNYDVTASNTEWAARPGGVWRPSVDRWLQAAL